MRVVHALSVCVIVWVMQGCPSTRTDESAGTEDAVARDGVAERSSDLVAGLEAPPHGRSESELQVDIPVFIDVHDVLGVEFLCDNGASPMMLMMQSTCGGVAWTDFDGDGWCDLYFPQGGYPFDDGEERRPSQDQLFRNIAGSKFANVTDASIPHEEAYGHGAVAGDFDNDGFDDLYISNVGRNFLYLNLGDGTFVEVSESAGIGNSLWSTSAAWFDLDLDGDLDIYVCNYLDYDPRNPVDCLDHEGNRGICHPKDLEAVPNVCYFNQGDGTFLEESDARGLNAPDGKSLGLVVADLTGDLIPDVYVANDVTPNHLFVGKGDGHFEERAHALGCALSGFGHAQASMGISYGDFDENGFADLYCTHFTGDSNTLYANYGPAGFSDETRKRDLHSPTLQYLAFGTVMLDFDFNGRQDVFIANGHIDDWREDGDLWHMPPQLFSFDGETFQECTAEAGAYFERLLLARGVATADFDNDGDPDLAVVHQNEESALLRNDSKLGHWLQLRFIGTESNRRGVGVQVVIEQGSRRLVQQLAGGTSYCAGHQPALFFGLGETAAPCEVSVTWPSGRVQHLSNVKVDQILVIQESKSEGL